MTMTMTTTITIIIMIPEYVETETLRPGTLCSLAAVRNAWRARNICGPVGCYGIRDRQQPKRDEFEILLQLRQLQ